MHTINNLRTSYKQYAAATTATAYAATYDATTSHATYDAVECCECE